MKNTNTLNNSCVETRKWSTFGKVLPTTAAILALLFAWKWSATEMWASGMNIAAQDSKITELTDSVISSPDTTEVIDLFPEMEIDWTSSENVVKSTTNELGNTLITQNSDSKPTKFTIETWVWYTVWWKATSCTRVIWSGKLFKGTKWETDVFWFVDVDNPMHTKWSWKLTLSKWIGKWLTLDWDYTFTGAWKNVARFGAWCTVKFWETTCKWKAFLVNSDWSPISLKTSIWTNIWEKWRLDAFMFINVGPKTYYGEIEYVHKINNWLSLFAEVRLWWSIDGKITSTDSQGVVVWVVVPIK